MNRALGMALVVLVLGAALGVYLLKDRVLRVEDELRRARAAVEAERSDLDRLRTEWAMLNQPGRLARLARLHLALQPATPSQIVRVEDLPLRADLDLGGQAWTVGLPSGGAAVLRFKPPQLLAPLPHMELPGVPQTIRIGR